jgi:uncharacterized protein (TIGR03435 family)
MRRLILLTISLRAFAPAQELRFEAVSVKVAQPGSRGMACTGGPGTPDPTTLSCRNYSLSFLIMMAYDLRPFQLKAPSWLDSARYDLTARVPPHTDPRQLQAMERAFLEERFRLRVHAESRETKLYNLTVSKGGPRISETTETTEAAIRAWRPPIGGPPRRIMARVAHKADTMDDLAAFLADLLSAPVRNATGLNGKYDYSLSFLMDAGGHAAEPGTSGSDEPDTGVSIFDALRQQLGLELKSGKGEDKVMVVDSADRVPSEN